MSSILKALKKLEQDPKGGGPAIDLWQRKSDQEKPFGRETRTRRRNLAVYLLFVPLLVIGGWLLRNYALPPSEKSQPGRTMPESAKVTAIDMPPTVVSAPKTTDLKQKSNIPRTPGLRRRRESPAAKKTAGTPLTGVTGLKKKEEKLPAVNDKARPGAPLKTPGGKPPSDSKPVQTPRTPNRALDSASRNRDLTSDTIKKSPAPPVSSHAPPTADKPAVEEFPALTGFSVQAIAWSKNPAERIAVINGQVVREGGVVEGMQVARIDLDEVYLKKGDKTWRLQCGR